MSRCCAGLEASCSTEFSCRARGSSHMCTAQVDRDSDDQSQPFGLRCIDARAGHSRASKGDGPLDWSAAGDGNSPPTLVASKTRQAARRGAEATCSTAIGSSAPTTVDVAAVTRQLTAPPKKSVPGICVQCVQRSRCRQLSVCAVMTYSRTRIETRLRPSCVQSGDLRPKRCRELR